jgi:Ni/Co efflux regulator RcnB
MQTRKIIASLAALSLVASSSLAFAAPDEHDRGHEQRGNANGHDRDGHDVRADVRRDYRSDDRRYDRRDGPGAGPDHAFYRGGRLPPEYRSRQYVVDDWRGHRLAAPPRGYHWVQTGGDYVLAAIATGVIASILLNNR